MNGLHPVLNFRLIFSSPQRRVAGEIMCMFDGNHHRADICQHEAVVFLRTARGSIWPLCQACSDKHKTMMVKLVANHHIEVPSAIGATFDIPVTDPDTLQAFLMQDPDRIKRVLAAVNATIFRKL